MSGDAELDAANRILVTPVTPTVTLRYFAAARAAAGRATETVEVPGATTLADVLATVVTLHAERSRVAPVLAVCSYLVADRPVGRADHAEVTVLPGDVIDVLPPFAGG